MALMNNETAKRINRLQDKINTYIDSSSSPELLSLVEDKMLDMMEQSAFWVNQKNPQRFLYELKNFEEWMEEFIKSNPNETS